MTVDHLLSIAPATIEPTPGKNTFRRKHRMPMFLLMEGTDWVLMSSTTSLKVFVTVSMAAVLATFGGG
eukprot:CAMPEP_0172053082 /NCGR_PEP_ID=MMETSP1043-20130122/4019_1 /TAXON_ID=464988 /ORGANISM="Hemiselmis andersenii, Strain CCMP441" /LENGTH=67 /DNA_ID=CAMNT_0012712313 /DNA_START=293 /DNA_END=493 /DNA_ORIENTATION=-